MTRRFLDQQGEMAERIRAHDWAATPLGPAEQWPEQLRFSVDLCLGSSFPTAIYWGPDLRLIYNDAWAPIPADRHPWALGRPAAEVWADIWDVVGPQFARVVESGRGFATYDQMLMMERGGIPRETYWNYSFTPIRDETTRVLGVLNQGNETTATVLGQRARVAESNAMRALFEQAPGAVAILAGPDHVFEIVNEAYHELVGADRDLVGRPITEALPEVVDQGFVELLDTVLRTGEPFRGWAVPVELRRGPEGKPETRLLDFVYQPIFDDDDRAHRIFVQASDNTERARATERLRETEERLQLALSASAGLGVWDWDVGSDRVVAGGPFAQIYGVSPEAASSGISIESFIRSIHRDDVERVGAAIRHALETGERFSEEYRLLQRGGGVRWVLAQGRPTMDARGKAVRFPGVSFDITERKEAEEAARRSADELRRTTEAQAFLFALAERQRQLDSPSAVMRLTASALGRRMGVDRAGFYRVTGEQIEFGPVWTNGRLPPLRGRLPVTTLGAEIAATYRAGETLVVDDAKAEAAHAPVQRYDSVAAVGIPLMRQRQWAATLFLNAVEARSWSRDDLALAEAVAEIAWDAVERASAVVALRESEEKFRGIANSIDQMIWSTLPDGFHDYYNERWYEFTGVSPGSTDGDGWNALFHPDDQERSWAVWSRCLATGEPYHIEYRLRHDDGTYRWVLGRAQPVRDEAGRIRRWFGTLTDIQEIVDAREVLARSRVELEELVDERTRALMAAEERLRHAQKMEAVGQLTGGIAHDFNNMLAVVIGALDLMERRLGADRPDLKRYLDAAADGATRAAQLTQRLLAFARQSPLEPKPVDANAMVTGMLDLLNRTLGELIRIEPVLAPELWWIEADPNQLENALLNLSVNARDAMPGGGALVLETANVTIAADAGRAFEILPGDYVQIAVTDTGSGMTPEVAAKAFDPFFTTKGVGKGTGLGLSQVFGFVRQSGGTVKLESVPGRGTTVRLYLPRRSAAAPLPTPTPQATGALPLGRPDEVVMVVEDEERVRTFSVEALRELGYTVVHAASGAEALARLDAGQAISLLFTDVVMPEMNGPELAVAVRARLPGVAVLFTSGYTGDTEVTDASGNPALVLPKPFGVDTLARRVRALLDR